MRPLLQHLLALHLIDFLTWKGQHLLRIFLHSLKKEHFRLASHHFYSLASKDQHPRGDFSLEGQILLLGDLTWSDSSSLSSVIKLMFPLAPLSSSAFEPSSSSSALLHHCPSFLSPPNGLHQSCQHHSTPASACPYLFSRSSMLQNGGGQHWEWWMVINSFFVAPASGHKEHKY